MTLRDLLGALASDAAAARAQADAAAMRIARIYRADPLLRTLPAPLFRLADLRITMPLLITSVPSSSGNEAPLLLGAATSIVQTLVEQAIAHAGGEMSGEQAAALARAIEAERQRLEHEPEARGDPLAVADRLMLAALNALPAAHRALLESEGGKSHPDHELLIDARARIVALAPTIGVEIAATTAAVESVGSRESLTQLSINLTERGVEWAIGETYERLVPE